MPEEPPFDLVIVGGLGHVGLPMGLVFAEQGLRVALYDTDARKAALVRQGTMPFLEHGAQPHERHLRDLAARLSTAST